MSVREEEGKDELESGRAVCTASLHSRMSLDLACQVRYIYRSSRCLTVTFWTTHPFVCNDPRILMDVILVISVLVNRATSSWHLQDIDRLR